MENDDGKGQNGPTGVTAFIVTWCCRCLTDSGVYARLHRHSGASSVSDGREMMMLFAIHVSVELVNDNNIYSKSCTVVTDRHVVDALQKKTEDVTFSFSASHE